jgi:hypothetical protein
MHNSYTFTTDIFGVDPSFFDSNSNLITDNIDFNNISLDTVYVDMSRLYDDVDYNSMYPTFILDKLNLFNNNDIPTISKKHVLLLPNSEYTFNYDTNYLSVIKNIFKFDKIDKNPIDVLMDYLYVNIQKKESILLPLSSGYDSRLLLACLLKLNIKFDAYSIGADRKFVETKLKDFVPGIFINYKIANNIKFIDNIIYDTNGFGDPFFWIFMHDIIKNLYSKYDIILSGIGHNEFFGINVLTDLNYWNFRFITGVGHHIKSWSSKSNMIYPFLNTEYISSCINIGASVKNEYCYNAIKKINPKLSDIPFPKLANKNNPKYGCKYNFNTRKTYLEILCKKFNT